MSDTEKGLLKVATVMKSHKVKGYLVTGYQFLPDTLAVFEDLLLKETG